MKQDQEDSKYQNCNFKSANIINSTSKEFQQRVLSAKEEIQKQKESAINESIMFLRKRVVDLEKQN